jgi:hypothetical protein
MSTMLGSAQPSTGATSMRRPAWVWVISIFFLFSFGYTLICSALVRSGAMPLTPAQRAYFSGLGVFHTAIIVSCGLLTLTATAFLLALRKIAVTLFGISFWLDVGFAVVNSLAHYSLGHSGAANWFQVMAGSPLVLMFLGWRCNALLFFYARSLRQRGVLR